MINESLIDFGLAYQPKLPYCIIFFGSQTLRTQLRLIVKCLFELRKFQGQSSTLLSHYEENNALGSMQE